MAEGGATCASPSPQGPDRLKGCQGDNVNLFCSFQPLLFLQVFENRAFQGKGSFEAWDEICWGVCLIVLEGKNIQASIFHFRAN